MSQADIVYNNMCKDILENGVWDTNKPGVRPKWSNGQPAHTIYKFGVANRYDLSKEFPIITTRPTGFKNCIDEIMWIWQRKSNNVNDLNSKIWDSWADENGSIGKAYAYQLKQKHQYREGLFDQVDRILYLLKHAPMDRGMITNMYVHQDLHAMNLRPCAYECTFVVTENRLNMTLKQRSSDVLTANNWNVVQYAVLQHMFAQASGLEVGEFLHVIDNAHIYDLHVPLVKEQINREVHPAPIFEINKDVKDFYKFTIDDFRLVDYKHGENFKIEVAV